ncbi:MAG TPA: ubiquinol-cytochrome c reductase iron-sulfur subunit [Thermoanaerobaculia bacterium]|nr:ubiquinol-cytochrome c reductase iron-sulfur subunit [Thermoanaerobaculia bacterium]
MSGVDRRELLLALAGGGALTAAATLAGCSKKPALKPTQALVPLSDVPKTGRTKILVAGRPVELRRTEKGVVARSLLCSHFGCTVAWNEERQVYVCPCHEGVYDASGAVVGGPPPQGLASVPVVVSGDDLIVGA